MAKKDKATNYVIIINTNDKNNEEVYFLLMGMSTDIPKTWVVEGYQSEEEGVKSFEEGYDHAHGRSYEGSMSACVNWMFFRPSVIKVAEGEKGLKRLVGKNHKLCTYSNVSGSYTGISLDPKLAKILWDRGRKPELWSPERHNKMVDEKAMQERLHMGESR